MHRFLAPSFTAVLVWGTAAFPVAQSPLAGEPQDGASPSLASRVLAGERPVPVGAGDAAARVAAAESLVDVLESDEASRLMLPVDDPERATWSNLPSRQDENGLRLGDLDEEELRAVFALLSTCLSADGYGRMRDIVLADDRLLPPGGSRPGFGTENFWLVLFGTPALDGAWGLQLDGHHLALNLSFRAEAMTMSPTFLGAQPASYPRDEVTIEPLGDALTAAYELAGALDEAQRAAAVVSPKRRGNVAAAGKDGFLPKPEGLACSELSAEQRQIALSLLATVVRSLPPEIARKRLGELEAELPEMHFAWSGPVAPKSDASFRLQGPTLILECAGQDLGGDPLDHLHLMFRDPTNEYGARL